MSLNPTKIEWCDFTWNPIVGCSKGCSYCYARKMAARNLSKCAWCRAFIPHLHRERLDAPSKRKKPARIFVGSMGDIFGYQVKKEWTQQVLDACNRAYQHDFFTLTKCPEGGTEFLWPPNTWAGVSITSQDDTWRAATSYPHRVGLYKAYNRFISFEPLLGPITMDPNTLQGIEWVIIGAQTHPLIIPDPKWTWAIIDQCRDLKIPVFLKDNLNFPIKVQQLPVRRR